MKKKIMTTAITALMFISLISVFQAGTVSAQEDPVPAVEFQTEGDGIAEWTAAENYSGDYSVRLYVSDGSTDWAEVSIPVDIPLKDITGLKFWEMIESYAPKGWSVNVILGIDADGDDVFEADVAEWHVGDNAWTLGALNDDTFVQMDGASGNPSTEAWNETDALTIAQWWTPDNSGAGFAKSDTYPWSFYDTLTNFIDVFIPDTNQTSLIPDTTAHVKVVKLLIGGSGSWMDETAYVDYVTINDVTYDLEIPSERPLTVDDDRVQCPDAYFQTIQAAIDAASPGDTIEVAAGTYNEVVTIDKSLTLLGAKAGEDARTRDTSSGESILDGTNLTPVVGVGAFNIEDGVSGVTIDGFEIRNYQSINPGSGSAVIAYCYDGDALGRSNITIQNNYMHDSGWNGVLVWSNNGVIQENFTIQFNLIENAPYAGIELTNVINSEVLNNKIIAPTSIVHDPGDAGVGIEIAVRAQAGQTITAGTNVLVENNEITGAFPEGPSTGISRAGINLLSRSYAATSSATLSGVTVRGNIVSGGTNVRAGILAVAENRSDGPATTTNLLIEGNFLDSNPNGIVVEGVGGGTHQSIAILGNTINDFNKSGIVVKDAASVQIEGNIISTTDHSVAPNGIQIGYIGATTGTTGTVDNNQISGCRWSEYDPLTETYEDDWTGSGILVIDTASRLTISGNEVQNCDVGLDIESGTPTTITNNDVHGNSYGFVLWNVNPTINSNNIYQNGLCGVYRTTGGSLVDTLDATLNWWGDPTGPRNPTTNSSATGDDVSDYVDYTPWLDAPHPGGTERSWNVQNFDTGDNFNSIQAAIDAAELGDTVLVYPGTYNENINIDKSLTVRSVEGAENTIINAQGVPIAVLINGADTVATFDGFTVGNYDTIGILAGAFRDILQEVSLGDDPVEVHILNNIVETPTIEPPHNNNIQVGDGTTGTIIGNEVSGALLEDPDWTGSGILVAGSSNVLVSNNYAYDCESGIVIVGYAEYRDAPAENNLIENNLVENNGCGISVQMKSIGTIIRYNDVLNNDEGIAVMAIDYSWEHSTPSGTEVHYNNIVGNENGVVSSVWVSDGVVSAEQVDATHNWWGHPSGPRRDKGNPNCKAGRGDRVSENVRYHPWLSKPFQTVLEKHVGHYGFEGRYLEKGWNTLSVPIYLDNNAWEEIAACLDENIAYRFNASTQAWELMTTGSKLDPLDAIYIRMNSENIVPLVVSVSIRSPPVKELKRGWNLIGLAVWEEENMSVDRALVSVELTPDGKRGYTIVVSSSLNQEPWIYTIVGQTEKPLMNKNKAYWVYMENPGNLAGFSFTPLPFWEPE